MSIGDYEIGSLSIAEYRYAYVPAPIMHAVSACLVVIPQIQSSFDLRASILDTPFDVVPAIKGRVVIEPSVLSCVEVLPSIRARLDIEPDDCSCECS